MVLNGTAVNFGFGSGAGITITGLTGMLLQNADHSTAADLESTRDGAGDEVTHGWYNEHDEATLEWVISGASITAAKAATVVSSLTPGTIIAITACANMPGLVADARFSNPTKWEVQPGVKISGSSTTSKRISVPIKRLKNIYAAAS